jgi:hypothetical protein
MAATMAGADPWVWRVVRSGRYPVSPADVDRWPLPVLLQALAFLDYDEAVEKRRALEDAAANAGRNALASRGGRR